MTYEPKTSKYDRTRHERDLEKGIFNKAMQLMGLAVLVDLEAAEVALADARARIAELEQDLRLNAPMRARQIDLAC